VIILIGILKLIQTSVITLIVMTLMGRRFVVFQVLTMTPVTLGMSTPSIVVTASGIIKRLVLLLNQIPNTVAQEVVQVEVQTKVKMRKKWKLISLGKRMV